jgi:signal transduction histidine kinase
MGQRTRAKVLLSSKKAFDSNDRRRATRRDRISSALAIKNRKFTTLNTLIEKTNQVLNFSEVINSALDVALEILELEAGAILLLEESTRELIICAHRGLSKEFIQEFILHPIKVGEGILGQVARSAEPIVATNNVADDPRIVRSMARREGLQLIAAWPLRAKGKVWGVMSVMSKHRHKLFSMDSDFLAAIGNHIGVTIENAWLHEESRRNQNELKSIVQELEARNKELEERNNELESFTCTVSHDLKNPLVSIQGFVAELVKEYGDRLQDGGQFYLSRIAANAERMERQIHDLLELAKVRQQAIVLERVDLGALLRDVLDELEYQIKQTGAEIVVAKGMPAVNSQQSKLKQVFINLVDNALKYIGRTTKPRIEIGFQENTDSVVFYVKDNGVGITREYHEKIFKIFERLPETKLLNPEGTGVGLAIVKKIIELQGGTVWLESEPGKGSTFFFSLRGNPTEALMESRVGLEPPRTNVLIQVS